MEKVLLEHFYKHLYDLSEAYYSDLYSSCSYDYEIRTAYLKAKTIQNILDGCGVTYEPVYVGYCGYEIDLLDFDGC